MRRFALVLALAVLTSSCAHVEPAPVPPPGSKVTLKGTIHPGPECPQLWTKDGRRYSLSGSLGTFAVGADACVKGEVVAMSTCMAGDATVNIESISDAKDCP